MVRAIYIFVSGIIAVCVNKLEQTTQGLGNSTVCVTRTDASLVSYRINSDNLLTSKSPCRDK